MTSSGLPSEKNYLIENEKQIESTYTELASNIKDLSLFLDNIESDFYRVYDSKSNDTLYYFVRFTMNEFEFATVYFYVNSDYQNQKNIIVEGTKSINGFNLPYEKHIELDEDFGIFRVKYQAKTSHKDINIYIEHTQLSVDEESNFFDFFEQTFRMPD